MKIYYYILFILCSFTIKGLEFIGNKNYEDDCYDINDIINYIVKDKIYNSLKEFNKDGYLAFNTQYCNLRDGKPISEKKCCYLSLLYGNIEYNFCGQVNLTEFKGEKNFIEKIIKDKILMRENYKEEIKDKLKIDCFGKKLNFIKIVYFFVLCIFI